MDTERIELLLKLILGELPDGATLALVVIAPAEPGWQAGTVVDFGMDADELEFAAECLTTPGDGTPLLRQAVH